MRDQEPCTAAELFNPLAYCADKDDPTVLENIERKIRYHQAEINRLEKSKVDMAPLLQMKIGDIREAMSY